MTGELKKLSAVYTFEGVKKFHLQDPNSAQIYAYNVIRTRIRVFASNYRHIFPTM